MKRIALSLIILFIIAGCNNAETIQGTDTTGVPSALDFMPVLHPGRFDSTGVVKTPPTNDDNVIVPDSAVKKN